ncbi:MAG: LysM peptidoglycan-binding domain-containing protein, partial [Bacteroidota bacterium]
FPTKNPEADAPKQLASAEQPNPDSAEIAAEFPEDIAGRDTPVDGAKYHFVQQGETLWRIALKYKVPVETIRDLNTFEGDNIRAGQRIRVQ